MLVTYYALTLAIRRASVTAIAKRGGIVFMDGGKQVVVYVAANLTVFRLNPETVGSVASVGLAVRDGISTGHGCDIYHKSGQPKVMG
ncbi:MAG: hypothetical protein KDA87_20830 [Planctomycetales bacterium]|nr:hypothetical protein [Planctomycetales bacterium]